MVDREAMTLEERISKLEQQVDSLLETLRLVMNSQSLTGEWLNQVRNQLYGLYIRQDQEVLRWRQLYEEIVGEAQGSSETEDDVPSFNTGVIKGQRR